MNNGHGYLRKWRTLSALVFSGFDTNTLIVVLPILTDELVTSMIELQWIINIYLLLLAAFLLIDLPGIKYCYPFCADSLYRLCSVIMCMLKWMVKEL